MPLGSEAAIAAFLASRRGWVRGFDGIGALKDASPRADAVAAVDLLVDPQKHRAEYPVGDHLVEALIGKIADRCPAGATVGRCWCGRGCRSWSDASGGL